MKVSLNFLNEFVDLRGIDVKEIVARLSSVTAEVEGYEIKGEHLQGIVVGEIVTCEKHPDSTKLNLLTVNYGATTVPVVCGAPNCRVGLKVAFARVGSKLGDIEIGVARLAGRESHGMCCSARELGISNDHDGIVELDSSAKIGASIFEAIPEIKDVVIEIDNKSLTNRPDLWGHYGIARELAVIFDKPLKPLTLTDLSRFASLPKIPIKIENEEDCLSYGLIRFENVTRRTSPMFMQIRLHYCGMGTHGFLIDLSNYIMLETGQPNHSFDARTLGAVSVGNIADGTPFTTLRNQTVITNKKMLFIKSDGKPVGFAGVIGGKNSEIEADTTDCVFEFATFDATCVRRSAIAIGVRTDASNRFEKSLDTNLNMLAAERTVKFIETYDKNARVTSCFSYVAPKPTKSRQVTVLKSFLEKFTQVKFDYDAVHRNLEGLGFKPIVTKDEISVTVPTWRATKDVTCGVDVIEEITRTYGYDNVEPLPPTVAIAPRLRDRSAVMQSNIKDILAQKFVFDEVHTYVWNDTRINSLLGIETPSYIKVVNSCIKESDALRSELIPSLISVVYRNRQLGEGSIFEIGRVWTGLDEKKLGKERTHLALVQFSKVQDSLVLYKRLSEIVRDTFNLLGYDITFKLSVPNRSFYNPKNSAEIYALTGGFSGDIGKAVKVGSIGILYPTIADAIEPKMAVVCAEIDLQAFESITAKKISAPRITKYQKSTLDFTFVSRKVYGELEKHFKGFHHDLCLGFVLKDIYEDTDGTLKYTLTFTIGSFEKTLTHAEIEEVWQAIINHGKQGGFDLSEQVSPSINS